MVREGGWRMLLALAGGECGKMRWAIFGALLLMFVATCYATRVWAPNCTEMVLKTTKGSTTDNIAENVQQDIDMQSFGSAVMQRVMEFYDGLREVYSKSGNSCPYSSFASMPYPAAASSSGYLSNLSNKVRYQRCRRTRRVLTRSHRHLRRSLAGRAR
jgi:hypothetical protein